MERLKDCLILSGRNGLYAAETAEDAGAEPALLLCRSAAKIRKDGLKLCAGDRVSVEDNGDGTGFIREVLPRRNALIRPPVANIGLLVVVVSASQPAADPFTVDKLTAVAENEQIPVAVAITKCETDTGNGRSLADIYGKTPYPVFRLSDGGKKGGDELLACMENKLTVFCGASGAGKSTLLNTLFPHMHAETGELSARIGRGKNTTRVTSLFRVSRGTYVADTPGFTSLDWNLCCGVPKEDILKLFPDLYAFAGSCRYTHCTHLVEEGCAVVEAVRSGEAAQSRHDSYCRLYRERKAHPDYIQSKKKANG